MKIIAFTQLPPDDQALLQEAASRLSYSINKITNPRLCAVVRTAKGHYYGNNIFLSNDTLACAESNALSAAAAAHDHKVVKMYLVIGRVNAVSSIVSPCGNCRQWLHDFARLHDTQIQVFSATDTLDSVMVTHSDELLPGGFKSAGLGRLAAET